MEGRKGIGGIEIGRKGLVGWKEDGGKERDWWGRDRKDKK